MCVCVIVGGMHGDQGCARRKDRLFSTQTSFPLFHTMTTECTEVEKVDGQSCLAAQSVGSRHYAVAFFLPVPNSCTDLDPTLLYILILRKCTKFVESGQVQLKEGKKSFWWTFHIGSGEVEVEDGMNW